MSAKFQKLERLSVRVPPATAEEVNRMADRLGVQRGHFYAVVFGMGWERLANSTEKLHEILPANSEKVDSLS